MSAPTLDRRVTTAHGSLAPTLLGAPGVDLCPPAHLSVGADAVSLAYGHEVVQFSREIGYHPDPAQQLALRAMLATDAGGYFAAAESGIVLGRQQGKTSNVLEPATLADHALRTSRPLQTVWTAHLYATARESFYRMKAAVDDYDILRRLVKRIRETNGEQEIEWVNGGTTKFRARSATGTRGISGEVVVLDEALFLNAEAMAATAPLILAQSNPQIRAGSSAPVATSTYLHELQRRGRAGEVAYVEWAAGRCADGPGCQHPQAARADGRCRVESRAAWREALPGFAYGRTQERVLLSLFRMLGPEKYGREVLGWGDEPTEVSRIGVERWDALADPGSRITGRRVYGVDVSPSLDRASVVLLGGRADGAAHVEVVEAAAGTAWLAAKLTGCARRGEVVAFGTSPARHVEADLGGVVRWLDGDTEAGAGPLLERAVSEAQVRHLDDPILSDALRGAASAASGDRGWRWVRRHSTADITPLVALTAAHAVLCAEEDLTGYDPVGNVG